MESDTRTSGVQPPYGRRWAALGVLSLTLFISAVDLLIVNAALRPIAVDLRTSIDELAWVVSAFMLALGSWPLAAGALGDRIGRKRLILAGLGLFGVASVVAAVAESSLMLIGARYVMGIGIGMVMPNAVATMRGIFTGRELAKALEIWAAAAGIGLVCGPLAGGFLLRHFDWGSIFLVNVPFAAIALVAGAVLIPETRPANPRRLDPLGIVLSVPAISALVWAMLEAPDRGWTSTSVLAALGTAAALAIAWVAWERRAPAPMVDLSWLRNGAIAGAVGGLMCAYGALVGALFLLSIWMQVVMNYDSFQTGVRLLPVAGALLVSVRIALKIKEARGARWVIAGGLALIAIGASLFATIDAGAGYGSVVVTLVLAGAGLGATLAPAQHLIVESLPERFAAIGTSLGDTARYVGAAIGLALATSVFSSGYRAELEAALEEPPLDRLPAPAGEAALDSLVAAVEVAARVGGPMGARLAELALSDGFFAGLGPAAWVTTAIAAVGAITAARLIMGGRTAVVVDEQAEPVSYAPAQPTFVYRNRPGELVVAVDAGGSRAASVELAGVVLRGVADARHAGHAVDSLRVCIARHVNPAARDVRFAADADLLERIRAVAAGVTGVSDVEDPVLDFPGELGSRLVIAADVADDRAAEACAAALGRSEPRLAEVLVCRAMEAPA